jgi:hypothetical protein
MKKDVKAWAVKLKGRSFHQSTDRNPFLYTTKSAALDVAMRIQHWESIKAEPVRVRVRIEEIE